MTDATSSLVMVWDFIQTNFGPLGAILTTGLIFYFAAALFSIAVKGE